MKYILAILTYILVSLPLHSFAEDKSEFLTPDLISVDPVVMMRSGIPSGCGYSFVFLFSRPQGLIHVVSGSFNFSSMSDDITSIAGTFKLIVGKAKMLNGTLDEKNMKQYTVKSAWAKTNNTRFEQTSKFLKTIPMADMPHYFGATVDIQKAADMLDTWEALADSGGKIGYNTTGHGYDVIIDLPAGLIQKQMPPTVKETVAHCMRDFLPEVKKRMAADIKTLPPAVKK
jgi:hypothetical protein